MKPSSTTVLVDLGGIFMYPQLETELKTTLTSITLRRIMSSATWMSYEAGKLSESECFHQLSDQYGFEVNDLLETIQCFRATISYNKDLASAFQELKEASDAKFVLVSNISDPDYLALRQRWDDGFWSIFDHVFTSSMLGVRKPSLRFYRQVLRATRTVPQRAFIIDDRPENVLAALSLGMHGTFCTKNIPRTLTNLLGDPVQRGLAFLQRNVGQIFTTTQHGETIEEIYAPLLILEVLKDRNLVNIEPPPRLWNFFSGTPKYTSSVYPEDLDTTSLALATVPYEKATIHSILDEMLDYVDEDGMVQAYFDKSRPRVDAVISLNVLTIFYKHDRGYELPETLDWIHNILLNRAYMNGTRYYPTAEWFLYYMTRLLHGSNDPALAERLEAPLRIRVTERIGVNGDAFCLGMRILACDYLGIENSLDRETLAGMQWEDGGWEPSCMYLFPGEKREVGHRGATTAFAVKALENWTWSGMV
ncbi:HAD-like protein [Aspergillus avenaceus]|uniref:HAD-like protein n=1 Tax=Aspergillus avenaceus TaxID=36643 RepID=A0A5N6TZK2_ASPAV|nr:HAD-like protein [Aspergillus avenaceus]